MFFSYLFILNVLCEYSIVKNYWTPIWSWVLELLKLLGTALMCSWRLKAKIHYTSFPVASPQHKRQFCNKLAWAKVRCVCCVVLFPKFHYNNLLPTSCLRGNVFDGCWALLSSLPPWLSCIDSTVVAFTFMYHSWIFCCLFFCSFSRNDYYWNVIFIANVLYIIIIIIYTYIYSTSSVKKWLKQEIMKCCQSIADVFISLSVCLSVCLYVCMCLSVSVCVCMCVWLCVFVWRLPVC